MKTVFVLFQTDVWKSHRSRIFCGVFDSFDAANQAAKANNIYVSDAEVVILETEVNKFKEQ